MPNVIDKAFVAIDADIKPFLAKIKIVNQELAKIKNFTSNINANVTKTGGSGGGEGSGLGGAFQLAAIDGLKKKTEGFADATKEAAQVARASGTQISYALNQAVKDMMSYEPWKPKVEVDTTEIDKEYFNATDKAMKSQLRMRKEMAISQAELNTITSKILEPLQKANGLTKQNSGLIKEQVNAEIVKENSIKMSNVAKLKQMALNKQNLAIENARIQASTNNLNPIRMSNVAKLKQMALNKQNLAIENARIQAAKGLSAAHANVAGAIGAQSAQGSQGATGSKTPPPLPKAKAGGKVGKPASLGLFSFKIYFAIRAAQIAVGKSTEALAAKMEDLQEVANLEAVLRATGNAAGRTSAEMQKMSQELSRLTNYTDTEITQGQALLATFKGIKGTTFDEALNSALDLSEVFGQDVKSSAIQIGKALNDPIRGVTALRRVGVDVSKEQEAQIKNLVEQGNLLGAQKIILKEINSQVGGAAKANLNPLTAMRNAFGELQEVAGDFVGRLLGGSKGMNGFTEKIYAARDAFQEWMDSVDGQRVIAVIRMILRMLGNAVKVIARLIMWLAERFTVVFANVQRIVTEIWTALFGKMNGIMAGFFQKIGKLSKWLAPFAIVGDGIEEFIQIIEDFKKEFDEGSNKLEIGGKIAKDNEGKFDDQALAIEEVTEAVKKQIQILSGAGSIWDRAVEAMQTTLEPNGDTPDYMRTNVMPEIPDFRRNFNEEMKAYHKFWDKKPEVAAIDKQTGILHQDLTTLTAEVKKNKGVFV